MAGRWINTHPQTRSVTGCVFALLCERRHLQLCLVPVRLRGKPYTVGTVGESDSHSTAVLVNLPRAIRFDCEVFL